MTATAQHTSQTAPKESRTRPRRSILQVYTWLIIAWLILPIGVMILFGFNNTTGRYNFTWQGFTFKWYRELFAIQNLTDALVNSLTIALIVTVVATILGTLIGLALGKYRFRGRAGMDLLLFANVAAPEIAIGAALLSLFVSLGVPLGYWTIVISHIMFDIAYVAITVRARAAGFDNALEEAARDLGADSWTTFRLITSRMLAPGILAGAMLAFALSIDDFIITQFTAGQTLTFPLWVYGSSRVGTPPQVNVMGTLIFVGGLLLVLGNLAIMRRKSRKP